MKATPRRSLAPSIRLAAFLGRAAAAPTTAAALVAERKKSRRVRSLLAFNLLAGLLFIRPPDIDMRY